ncbi:MAG TPA: TonB-dependent receptor, partial [Hyphomicrobium sp.]|nr:TonB-dependent receptor [Hyphomicrobium sp.]
MGDSIMRAVRTSVTLPSKSSRSEATSLRLFTAFCMLAASPATIAVAQQAAEPAELPPLVVEGSQKKKKSTAAAKKAATSPAPQPPPAVEPLAERPAAPPLPGQAGPVPPGEFKADYSTSPKFTGPLLDTPQTVTVVPGTLIQERGTTNLTEVLRQTPGITFDSGENGFSTSMNNFKLRGFDSSGSIFTDGVRSSGSFARDMFNIEQVEVVKGSAADNGRGGAAGYINLVTKTPQEENFVRGEASIGFDEYDSDARFRSTLDVNQRIGTVGVRMNGMIEDGGVPGRDVAEANAYGVAPSITFGLGTDTRATFAYERLERNDLPDWGVPGASVEGMFNYDPIAGRRSRDNFYGLTSDFDDVESDSVMAKLEHDISDNFTISNVTRWNESSRYSRFTVPTGFTPATEEVTTQRQSYDRVNRSIANLTNLAGTFVAGGFRHTISTGVEYTHEESDSNRFGTQNAGPTDIFNPDPGRFDDPFLAPTERAGVEIDTVAAYFYDTIQLSRQWQLVGGLRVEHYNVDVTSVEIDGTPTPDYGNFEDSETTLSGKVGLVYKPVREGTLYASYGTSALPPGSYLSNPDISRTGENVFPGLVVGADPVRAHNYEVGVKWDWFGGRLATTAAAFLTEKENVPYNGAPGYPEIVYGEQQVRGIEFGIAGSVTERWKVFGGLTLLDSERKHGLAVDDAARGDYGANPAAGFPGATTTDGDELSFTPNVSATLWTTYDVTDQFTLG